MILTRGQIEAFLGSLIVIDPFEPKQLNPNSYNMRLHEDLLIYERPGGQPLDMRADNPTRRLRIPAEGLVLEPGRLYLGRTIERTETRGLVPQLQGRSSTGRLGLSVHVTAGFGDIGFRGFWTLELTVVEPLRVYAGEQVCQIIYHVPESGRPGCAAVVEDLDRIAEAYAGRYQDNRGVQPSRLWLDHSAKEAAK